jgi:Spy/CpxP family protein refolding chaperone
MVSKKIFSAVVMGSLLFVCGNIAVAQRQAGQMMRLRRVLALTDTQAKDIAALQKSHREAAFPLRQELRARNNELRTALDADEPNPTAIGQLVLARRGITNQLRTLRIKLRGDIAAVLTPEQKQKFEQLKSRPGRRSPRG